VAAADPGWLADAMTEILAGLGGSVPLVLTVTAYDETSEEMYQLTASSRTPRIYRKTIPCGGGNPP
jgi:hypothetical protein